MVVDPAVDPILPDLRVGVGEQAFSPCLALSCPTNHTAPSRGEQRSLQAQWRIGAGSVPDRWRLPATGSAARVANWWQYLLRVPSFERRTGLGMPEQSRMTSNGTDSMFAPSVQCPRWQLEGQVQMRQRLRATCGLCRRARDQAPQPRACSPDGCRIAPEPRCLSAQLRTSGGAD